MEREQFVEKLLTGTEWVRRWQGRVLIKIDRIYMEKPE